MFTLPLNSPQATLANTGGKGMNLARLARAGLPVPGGFLITTQAYREFVAGSHLGPFIQQTIEQTRFQRSDCTEHSIISDSCPIWSGTNVRRDIPDNCQSLPRFNGQSSIINRQSPCRCALLSHGRRFTRYVFCRTARYLSQCHRRGGPAQSGRRLLEQFVDGAGHRLPGTKRYQP